MEKPQNGCFELKSRNKWEAIAIQINAQVKFGLKLMARLHTLSVAQSVDVAIPY